MKKKNEKIKLIIFDLDGTALNTDLYIVMNHTHLCEKYKNGEMFDVKTLVSFSGPTLEETFDKHYPGINKEALFNDFMNFSLKYSNYYSRLYDNEIVVLDKLKEAGYELAILTTKKRIPTQNCMKHFGLDKYFTKVVSYEDVAKVKPDPCGIIDIMKHFNVSPEETFMIGDSTADYYAGVNAKCHTIVTTWGLKKLPELNPTYFVNSFDDIKEIFIDE